MQHWEIYFCLWGFRLLLFYFQCLCPFQMKYQLRLARTFSSFIISAFWIFGDGQWQWQCMCGFHPFLPACIFKAQLSLFSLWFPQSGGWLMPSSFECLSPEHFVYCCSISYRFLGKEIDVEGRALNLKKGKDLLGRNLFLSFFLHLEKRNNT